MPTSEQINMSTRLHEEAAAALDILWDLQYKELQAKRAYIAARDATMEAAEIQFRAQSLYNNYMIGLRGTR